MIRRGPSTGDCPWNRLKVEVTFLCHSGSKKSGPPAMFHAPPWTSTSWDGGWVRVWVLRMGKFNLRWKGESSSADLWLSWVSSRLAIAGCRLMRPCRCEAVRGRRGDWCIRVMVPLIPLPVLAICRRQCLARSQRFAPGDPIRWIRFGTIDSSLRCPNSCVDFQLANNILFKIYP